MRKTRLRSFILNFNKKPLIFNKYRIRFQSRYPFFLFLADTLLFNFFYHQTRKAVFIKKILYTFANGLDLHKYVLRRYTKNRATALISQGRGY